MLPLQLLRVAVTPLLVLALTGCGPTKNEFDALAAKNATLEKAVKELTSVAAEMNNELGQLRSMSEKRAKALVETRVALMDKVDKEAPAVLGSSDGGFAVAYTNVGTILVSIEDAHPYLDGHKVRLSLGNPSQALYSNVEIQVTYGPRDPEFPQENVTPEKAQEAWDKFTKDSAAAKAARKTVKVSSSPDLRAGSWTIVEVILSPSKPEDLGRLEVKVTPGGVSLNKLKPSS